MFSLFTTRFRKASKAAERPTSWYDPTAHPTAPILLVDASSHHNCQQPVKRVRWWNEDTLTVVGVFSPSPCQGQPAFGFNTENGNSYLPDYDGDISWDTIKASTEEGYNLNQIILSPSPSSSSSSDPPSDDCSSGSSDSNLSMVVTDEENGEAFYFAAVEAPECLNSSDNLFATAMIIDSLLDAEEERDDTVAFGGGRPPRRASTITGLVGSAIRQRRSRLRSGMLGDYGYVAETSIRRYRCGGGSRRGYIPHILTTIMEDMDEE
ncbi:hypothetical protein DXG01_011488 [Tephrocybe rancida]|nr:hypothetical protein DXG01_011488 [Tephrocybe rancida]